MTLDPAHLLGVVRPEFGDWVDPLVLLVVLGLPVFLAGLLGSPRAGASSSPPRRSVSSACARGSPAAGRRPSSGWSRWTARPGASASATPCG